MSYYTTLINAWNTGTVPTGVVGSALTGQSTAQKLININAWVVTATIPSSYTVTGAQIANCINWTEFAALTATQQSNVLALCNISTHSVGSSAAEIALLGDGMIVAYFPSGGATITSLSALAPSAQPWWQVNGYTGPFSQADLTAAGGLT
jgi:hypothetical protein